MFYEPDYECPKFEYGLMAYDLETHVLQHDGSSRQDIKKKTRGHNSVKEGRKNSSRVWMSSFFED